MERIFTFRAPRGMLGLATATWYMGHMGCLREGAGVGGQNKDRGSVRRPGEERACWQAATQSIMVAFPCQHI